MDIFGILKFLILLTLGYVVGTIVERRHFRSIRKREKELNHIPVRTDRFAGPEYNKGFIVSGSVVISVDYFKMVSAALRNLIGGRVSAFEALLDRARREATLRMKESARSRNAVEIINFRIEAVSLFKKMQGNGTQCVEVFAYGTALRKDEVHPT